MEELVSTTVMEVNGFKGAIKRAEKLKDIGRAHGLPVGQALPVYPIETLPGAPSNWVREAGSYVVPVDPDVGIWFDWTMNDGLNTAIVPSVKGMNPITGMALDGIRLEAYMEQCPKHKKNFQNNRFCEECGFSWPMNNYIAAPNTLWWDGFRQPDGKVRQFFFTADEKRDIASYVIGKQNTVPAFGFAFYKPKTYRAPQVQPINITTLQHVYHYDYWWYDWVWNRELYKHYMIPPYHNGYYVSSNIDMTHRPENDLRFTCSTGGGGASYSCNSVDGIANNAITNDRLQDCAVTTKKLSADEAKTSQMIFNTQVAVGAGAEISQELLPCSLGLDGWQDSHAGIIRLYFVFGGDFETIKRKGIKQIVSKQNGFMSGMPVGD